MGPIQIILFLIGLFIVLLFLIIGRRRPSILWRIATSVGVVLIVISFLMPRWKIYQCRFTTPDQIDVYGHVKGDSNSYLNGYMVLLYEGNVETANNITRRGSFARNKKDMEDDGYFEFEIPNTEQFNRCSLTGDFKQANSRPSYLWQDFNGLRPGANFQITLDERKKKYTLVVLPRSAGDYPNLINIYHTYLDSTGNPAINIPLKTYTMYGDSAAETETGYYVAAHPLSTAAPGILFPVMLEVQDAWVEDDSTTPINLTTDSGIAAEEIVDIDNCTGSETIDRTETRSKVYIHEVQFQGSPLYASYDLGQVARKAANSLGFMQGKIDVSDATITVRVPPWKHFKYKIVWHDQWKSGNIRVDSGMNSTAIPFRARVRLSWEPLIFPVDCP